MPAQSSPTVLIASDDASLLDEVIRFTEEIPHWRLLPPVRSRDELSSAIQSHVPDVVVASEGIVVSLQPVDIAAVASKRVLLIARNEEPVVMKHALKLGLGGFVLWPRERGELRALVDSGRETTVSTTSRSGRLTAIWGPKGGTGSTVLAAHLSAASARAGKETLLIDLDLNHGDQSILLPSEGESKTVLDLLRVANEITPLVIDQIAHHHSEGLKVIFSPGSPGEIDLIKSADVVSALRLMKESVSHLVVDLPSGIHELALTVAEEATTLVLVVTCDVLSLKRSRDAMRLVKTSGIDIAKVLVVVNAYSPRGEISIKDVEAVIGRPVAFTIRGDPGLATAPDRGELSASGLKAVEAVAAHVAGIGDHQARTFPKSRRRKII